MKFLRALFVVHGIYHYLPALVVLIMGLYLTLASALYINSVNNFGRSVIFTNDARQRVEMLQNAIIENVSVINQVRNFFAATNSIDRQEFSTFVAPILAKYPGIKRIEWIPRVVDHERAIFESESPFTERQSGGQITNAGNRKEYFPIYFVEPFRLEDKLLGYDLGSDIQLLKALNIISKTGRNVAVPISPKADPNSKNQTSPYLSELFVFAPIYPDSANESDNENNNGPAQGFIRIVLDMDLLVKSTIFPLYPRKIDLVIEDLDANPKQNVVYYYSTGSHKKMPDVAGMYRKNNKFLYASLIHFLGRTWQMTCVAVDPFYNPLSALSYGQVWGIGLTITLSLTIYLVAITHAFRKLRYGNNAKAE